LAKQSIDVIANDMASRLLEPQAAHGSKTMPTAEDTVRAFWRLMASNDFHSLKPLLADSFVLEWPQSNERIRGADNFIRMNVEYPTQGTWTFDIQRLVASAEEAVTQVAITDGQQSALALSFFQVKDGKVVRLVEYWPESYAAPANRAHLTEPLQAPASPGG
jgi:ketosteroid isomerase-like protein